MNEQQRQDLEESPQWLRQQVLAQEQELVEVRERLDKVEIALMRLAGGVQSQ